MSLALSDFFLPWVILRSHLVLTPSRAHFWSYLPFLILPPFLTGTCQPGPAVSSTYSLFGGTWTFVFELCRIVTLAMVENRHLPQVRSLFRWGSLFSFSRMKDMTAHNQKGPWKWESSRLPGAFPEVSVSRDVGLTLMAALTLTEKTTWHLWPRTI